MFTLPEPPALLRCRLTLRLLADATLPALKGPLLRGGFGYAFQKVSCPQACWHRSEQCQVVTICPYRWIFETPRPPGIAELHDLQNIPRPFVLTPPDDLRTDYPAGSTLDFELVLIGRSVQWLPFFVLAFDQFARGGLGRDLTPARLERIEALAPWAVTGLVIFQDGRAQLEQTALPMIDGAAIEAHAAALGPELRLILATPLRLKHQGRWLEQFHFPALVQALCWRLSVLATFHGAQPWVVDHRALVALAQTVVVVPEGEHWADRSRISRRRGGEHTMEYGGLLGSVRLHGVPHVLRVLLLLGSHTHVGKACVFGNGALRLTRLEPERGDKDA